MADEQEDAFPFVYHIDGVDEPLTMAPEHAPRRGGPSTVPRVKEILSLPSLTSQIQAFMSFRNCFSHDAGSPSFALLDQYMAGSLPLQETIDRIAAPIEDCYLTGDHCDVENDDGNGDGRDGYPFNSAVGMLMDLWYGVMHMAKLTPWQDEKAQMKLVGLIAAFRARPTPLRTEEQQKLVDEKVPDYWDYSEGTLWHELPWYGLCAAEGKNDTPGCGSDTQYAEGIAWANLMGYQCRLALSGDPTAAWNQEIDALGKLDREQDPQGLDVVVPAATVWVLLMREKLWERSCEEIIEKVDPSTWGWFKDPRKLWTEKKGESTSFSTRKWVFWKRRFGDVAGNEGVLVGTARMAGMVVEVMDAVERGGEGDGKLKVKA